MASALCASTASRPTDVLWPMGERLQGTWDFGREWHVLPLSRREASDSQGSGRHRGGRASGVSPIFSHELRHDQAGKEENRLREKHDEKEDA